MPFCKTANLPAPGVSNKFTGEQTGPFPFADFPDHKRLTDCYHHHTGIDLEAPSASLLFQPDSPAYPEPRYYQDASIRAAFEKMLQSDTKGEAARVLLSLATGSGKPSSPQTSSGGCTRRGV